MSWLSNLTPPGIKAMFRRPDDATDSLWVKCPGCGQMLFGQDLEKALHVCAQCGHHHRQPAEARLKALFDGGVFRDIDVPPPIEDPLGFRDEKKYADRLKEYRRKTGRPDAMRAAIGEIDGMTSVAAVQDFDFMGGSMGMALGETMIRAAETAVGAGAPLIAFTASGGARMQEGILSLMQMPRTTIAVQMMREAALPYIVVLTHPTTGGVTASFAMLGDIHIAEPGALIGFAGPRVIEQTIREKLPEGFQRAEFLKDKGMVDLVCPRAEMKAALSRLIRILTKSGDRAAVTEPAPAAPASRAAE